MIARWLRRGKGESLRGLPGSDQGTAGVGPPASQIATFNESDVVVELDGELVLLATAAASPMMDSEELVYLLASLHATALGPEDLVAEIGAYVGATTILMHRALERMGNTTTRILSIDPFERAGSDSRNPQGSYREYLRNILDAGAGGRCFALAAFSQDAHPVVPDRIGLLVVDGDHHFESVWNDLTLYADKVRPGGIVFVDDYVPSLYPDVHRAVNEFLALRPDFVPIHRSWFAILRRTRS